MDFFVFKQFPVFRESTLEFGAEAFNIINTTNFANPNATIQVAQNLVQDPNSTDPTNRIPGNAYVTQATKVGTITGLSANYNPRQIQFALKYQF